MIFLKLVEPSNNERRIVHKFLWFPRSFNSSKATRWLEFAYIVEEYHVPRPFLFACGPVVNPYWIELGFAEDMRDTYIGKRPENWGKPPAWKPRHISDESIVQELRARVLARNEGDLLNAVRAKAEPPSVKKAKKNNESRKKTKNTARQRKQGKA